MYVYNRIRNKIFTVYVQYNNSRIYIWNYTTALDRDEHANHNSHDCLIHIIYFSLWLLIAFSVTSLGRQTTFY